jgi:hypothetical protein
MLQRTCAALAFGLLAAAAVAAPADDEAIAIKLYAPKAGDRVRVTQSDSTVSETVIEVNGKKETKTDRTSQTVVYVQEVLTGGEAGKKPEKAKRTYEKFESTLDGNTYKHPLEGKSVLIEKKAGKYEFTGEGGAIDGPAAEVLSREFNRPDDALEKALLPANAVKPGDTWKIEFPKADDPNALPFDPAKVVASGKLAKVYSKDGAQFGVVEISLKAPVTSLGPDPDLKVKEGSFTVAGTIDGCLDGSSPSGTSEVKFEFKVSAENKGTPFTVSSITTKKSTHELLAKK